MISALTWVGRGVAKSMPAREFLDDADEEALKAAAAEMREEGVDEADEGEDSDAEGKMEETEAEEKAPTPDKKSKKKAGKKDEVVDLYNLDDYDDEDEGVKMFGAGMKGLMYHESNDDDPYVTVQDDDDEEEQDLVIRPQDAILVAAKTEDDLSNLEVYVFDEADDNLYVHHDILLPDFPLCVEPLDVNPNGGEEAGNFLAVGTFRPEIEIWDLDVLDVLDPVAVFGGEGKEGLKVKKNKKSKPVLLEGSHRDSVLALAWNRRQRNVLASGSADMTVKLWEVNTQKCVATLSHHNDKVQATSWNPSHATVLATGSFDRTVCVLDVTAPSAVTRFNLASDVEALCWDPHHPEILLTATEDGNVTCFDPRAGTKPVWTLTAHNKPCSALMINPRIPNMMVTGSPDKTIKVWDIEGGKPTIVHTKKPDIGAVFTVGFLADSPYYLAAGGNSQHVYVWDTRESKNVRSKFSKRARAQNVDLDQEPAKGAAEVLGNMDIDDDDDDEDEEGGKWVDVPEGEQNGEEAEGETMEEEVEEEKDEPVASTAKKSKKKKKNKKK